MEQPKGKFLKTVSPGPVNWTINRPFNGNWDHKKC